MGTLGIVLLVAVVMATDFFVVSALFGNLRSAMWKPLSDAFPSRPPGRDAVRREFQSLQVGIFNLGWGAHLTADSECLHIDPCAILRWFRMVGMSVPWEQITVVRRSRSGSRITIRILKTEITGPAWAFGLADPG